MEAMQSNSGEEDLGLAHEEELVRLLEGLLEKVIETQKSSGLPEDLYVLPGTEDKMEDDHPEKEKVEKSEMEALASKKK
jgi:hypothetical protein